MSKPTDPPNPFPDDCPETCPALDSRNLSPAEREQATKICHELMEREFWRSQTTRLRIIEAAYASMADTYERALAKNGGDFVFRPPSLKGGPPTPLTDGELDAMISAVRKETGIPEPVACAPTQPPPAPMTLDELIDLIPPPEPCEKDGSSEAMAKDFPLIFGEAGLTKDEQDWTLAQFLPLLARLNDTPLPPGIRYVAKVRVGASIFHFLLTMQKEFEAAEAKRRRDLN